MKKSLLIFALLALVTSFSFAQGIYSGTNNFQADIYAGNAALTGSMLGTQVTPYASNSKYAEDPAIPFVLNFFIGWGIGSFVQGDTKGGVTALIGDLLSDAVIGAGAGLWYSGILQGKPSLLYAGIGCVVAGGIAITAFRIYELVRPFTYAKNYVALNEFDFGNTSLTLAPVIDTVDKNYGIAATFKL